MIMAHAVAGDTTSTYTYPAAGGVRPHAVSSVSTVGPGVNTTDTYGYDDAGNTTSRPGPTAGQTLTWDTEGRPATAVENGATTSFLYSADGARLITNDGTTTTLYLPGEEVRRNNSTGAVTGTRYYSWAGQAVGMVSTGGPLTWLVGDHQGTQQISVTVGQVVSRRWQNPYGERRGTPVSWPNQKGFVGGDNDASTGLVQIGARQYDPGTGQFTSVDAVFDGSDPQSWQAYGYAGYSPITFSDPTGNIRDNEGGYSAPTTPEDDINSANTLMASANQAKNDAEHVKNKSMMDIIVDAGVSFLLDFFGITDVWNCISKGDVGACVNALIGVLPVGKIFKAGKSLIKGIDKAFSAYKAWRTAVRAAETAIRQADEAIAYAQKKLDDAMARLNAKRAEPGGVEAPSCPVHSFDPDTPVVLSDGSTKPIKDVEVGDEVLATDPESGVTTGKKVSRLHRNQDTALTDVTIEAGDGGTSVLHTTQHHPFWDETTHTWTSAADLKPGDRLRSSTGEIVTVAKVRNFTSRHEMRDLTVTDIHTYYVIAGNTPVLVHNCGDGRHSSPETAADSDYVGRHRADDEGANVSGEGADRSEITSRSAPSLYDRTLAHRNGIYEAYIAQDNFDTRFGRQLGTIKSPYGDILAYGGRAVAGIFGYLKGHRAINDYPAKHRK